MSEFMNDGPSSAGSSSGQAPLSGGTASGGGMAPQRIKTMAAVRPRMSRSLNTQEALPRGRKSIGSKAKLLLKKGAKKADLDDKKARMLKKRVALRTLRKGQ